MKYPSNDNGSFSFDIFLSSIAVKTFTGLYMSSTAGVLEEAGTAYPSLAPGFIPGFVGVRIAHLFSSVLRVVFLSFVCLHSVSCASNVASVFPFLIALWFYLTFIC